MPLVTRLLRVDPSQAHQHEAARVPALLDARQHDVGAVEDVLSPSEFGRRIACSRRERIADGVHL